MTCHSLAITRERYLSTSTAFHQRSLRPTGSLAEGTEQETSRGALARESDAGSNNLGGVRPAGRSGVRGCYGRPKASVALVAAGCAPGGAARGHGAGGARLSSGSARASPTG